MELYYLQKLELKSAGIGVKFLRNWELRSLRLMEFGF